MAHELDGLLKQVIYYLAQSWMNPEVGLVASGIFHSTYLPSIATSEQRAVGKWLHAERNAIQRFEEMYGNNIIGPNSIVVVTLTPCVLKSDSREGSSCLDLFRDKGIKQVHAGVLDSSHTGMNIKDYQSLGINLTLTEDKRCRIVCQKLLQIFEKYGQRVNSDIQGVKQEVDYHFFEEM